MSDTAAAQPKLKGPRLHRVLIGFLTIVLTLLVFFLLGFILRDIGSWRGPAYDDVQLRVLDQGLLRQSRDLDAKIADLNREVGELQERQTLLRDSTDNSRQTMNQLLELQRLGLSKDVKPSAAEQDALAEAERLFLADQRQYQGLNAQVAELKGQLRHTQSQKREVQRKLDEQRQPVQREYDRQLKRHNLKVAAVKLTVLVPLLAVAVALIIRKRRGTYAPLIYAFGIAVFIRVGMVLHDHFPTRHFKYILIGAALLATGWAMVYLLRIMVAPAAAWVLKQYREAYESFLCPVCAYPIRQGPLRFAFWTRRTIHKVAVSSAATSQEPEVYTCPVCATRLYEPCPKCGKIRHALLPACTHCGQTKQVSVSSASA